VRPRTVWIGERSSKGYVLEEMLDAFRRYVPRSEVDDLRGRTWQGAEEEKEKKRRRKFGEIGRIAETVRS
jgi:hypothetical protein